MITTILEQNLFPVGTTYTNSILWQAGAKECNFVSVLGTDDLQNPDIYFYQAVEISLDGGATWEGSAGGGQNAGSVNRETGQYVAPNINIGAVPGITHARGRFELTAPLSIGCTAEFS
jgi:hypothetical protein